MTNIRKSLNNLADVIEHLASQPVPAPEILDRGLSGNKINGGKITNFSSIGIKDNATYEVEKEVLVIENDRIVVPSIETSVITKPLTVQGDLAVLGEVHATKLHVNEISADVRNERTAPLEFKAEKGSVANKGLLWTGTTDGRNKQLTMQHNPDRLFSSENIDLAREKEYKISGQTVLTSERLGPGVRRSSLTELGTLDRLEISGSLTIDNYVHYDPDSMRFGIGTLEPNGMFSTKSLEHEFVIDYTDEAKFKVGTWTTNALDIITDDTRRISIASTGAITAHERVSFTKPVGIGVKNFSDDASITTAGPVRFQDKKFEVGDSIPVGGSYRKGDVVWNSNPRSTSYVGWVCIKDGTPGEWKPFGQIA